MLDVIIPSFCFWILCRHSFSDIILRVWVTHTVNLGIFSLISILVSAYHDFTVLRTFITHSIVSLLLHDVIFKHPSSPVLVAICIICSLSWVLFKFKARDLLSLYYPVISDNIYAGFPPWFVLGLLGRYTIGQSVINGPSDLISYTWYFDYVHLCRPLYKSFFVIPVSNGLPSDLDIFCQITSISSLFLAIAAP